MTVAERQKQKDRELIHRLYEKYYGKSKKREDLMAKRMRAKQAEVKQEAKENRNDLMLQAKEKGIKNFRVLNKEELQKVLNPKATKEAIEKVIQGAVARWKSGWGSRGKHPTPDKA